MGEVEEQLSYKNLVTKIADLDINKIKLILPYIEENLKKGTFILDIFPMKMSLKLHKSFVENVDETLKINEEELREISTTFGFILSDIIKKETSDFLNIVEKKYFDHLDKCKELYSYIENNFNLLNEYREKYLLKIYSKCYFLKSIEWDVQKKFYHSDIEQEMPFPLAMIRLIFYTPLFVEGKKENFSDITFETSLSDIITLKEEFKKIEDKLQNVIKRIEA